MKKLFLLLIVITGASQLRAQQLGNKPSDPFLLKTPQELKLQQFKLGDSTLFKGFSALPKGQQLAAMPNKLLDNNLFAIPGVGNIDNMPILKVSGNVDRMPIAKMDGKIDRMPILKVTPLDPLKSVNP